MRLVLFLSLFLLLPSAAHACAYERVQFDVALNAAEKAFIGTVASVEGRLAKITVEKPVRGVEAGETLEVEIGESSCAIRFQKGQQWLYLGATQPSGSIQLKDEQGREIADNIKLVNEKLVMQDREIISGTIERSCAPWDGEAQMITLDNGVTASFYDSIAPLEKKDRKDAAVFPADGKQERGHGQIVRCPMLNGKPTDQPCNAVKGTITIGPVDSFRVRGNVETEDGLKIPFDVKRVEKQVFCG